MLWLNSFLAKLTGSMRVLVTCTGSQSREESEALPCNYTNRNQYPINTQSILIEKKNTYF